MVSFSKPLLSVFTSHPVTTPPIWFMRQAGRYLPEYREVRKKAGGFLELCYSPELAAKVTLQPIQRFHMDGAIIFSDILVIPDAIGIPVAFKEGEGPFVTPLNDTSLLSGFSPERMKERLTPVYEALRIVARELPKETTLIGFAGSPWTIATYIIEGRSSKDFTLTKTHAYQETELFTSLIEVLINSISTHLIAQIDAGAEVVQLFDSWAGVLPEGLFRKWVIEPTKRIVQAVKTVHPTIPIIGFPRGANFYYKDYAENTGVDAVCIDFTLPHEWVKSTLQPHKVVQGNLDPAVLLCDTAVIDKAVDKILYHFRDFPFIFNLGHGILPSTPIDHVHRVVDRIRGKKGR